MATCVTQTLGSYPSPWMFEFESWTAAEEGLVRHSSVASTAGYADSVVEFEPAAVDTEFVHLAGTQLPVAWKGPGSKFLQSGCSK